jgi:Xaa-Pro dipeptidase
VTAATLTLDGCRQRQERFCSRLEEAGISAALISSARDIYYFTGLLPESPFPYPSLLFLGPGLKSWLVTGLAEGEGLLDERIVYPLGVLSTLNPDHVRNLARHARDTMVRAQNLPRLGFQREGLQHAVADAVGSDASPGEWVEIDEILQELQLRKDADEIACIRRSVSANLAAYTRAQQVIRPGATEMEVMTECQTAAQRHSGEVHFYNGDFRSGTSGGFARDREVRAGELYIIDAWSDVGGYWCDMARTWAVDGNPTELQAGVYDHLKRILESVPRMARAGRSTIDFWHEIDSRIREHPHLADRGLTHHAGHGVGLRVHEGPDLNRDRGGVFEVGNVFTCEPGAYSPELNGGVRIENVFFLGAGGVEVLSDYPLSLVAAGPRRAVRGAAGHGSAGAGE